MIDSHAHYSRPDFDGSFRCLTYADGGYSVIKETREELFGSLKEFGIESVIEPAIDIDSNYAVLKLCEENRGFIYPAVGLHPKPAAFSGRKRINELKKLAKEEGVVAIGEAGLDYSLPRKKQRRLRQKSVFRYLLRLARKNDLPLILHERDAHADALRILKRSGGKLRGVAHCFSGGASEAADYLDLGFFIGIGGMLLRDGERSRSLREAAAIIPLDRILLETDAPFMRPVSEAGGEKLPKKVINSSSVILAVAEEIARIKGTDAEQVVRAATENTKKLFGIG